MGEVRPRTLEDMLALEAMELSLERERLDVMEDQVTAAEASLASREARVQVEVDEGVAGIRRALAKEHLPEVEAPSIPLL